LDDEPSTGPVEEIRDDLVAAPAVQPAEEAQSADEVGHVTPARETLVGNSFGDLFSWLDPGVKPAIRAAPRGRTTRIVSAA